MDAVGKSLPNHEQSPVPVGTTLTLQAGTAVQFAQGPP
jgi:hypothetical protein